MQVKILPVFLICLLISGCSTVASLRRGCEFDDYYGINQQPVYGGSRDDISTIVAPWTCHGEGCNIVLLYPILLPYSLVDLPFSVVADTLVLPYTYNKQHNKCPKVELIQFYPQLRERIVMVYSSQQYPDSIWLLSSRRFKGNMTKTEFMKYLEENGYVMQNGGCSQFVSSDFNIDSAGKVKVLMNCTKERRPPLYLDESSIFHDYWVYENNNWYIDEAYR